jgi:hypothetical protein
MGQIPRVHPHPVPLSPEELAARHAHIDAIVRGQGAAIVATVHPYTCEVPGCTGAHHGSRHTAHFNLSNVKPGPGCPAGSIELERIQETGATLVVGLLEMLGQVARDNGFPEDELIAACLYMGSQKVKENRKRSNQDQHCSHVVSHGPKAPVPAPIEEDLAFGMYGNTSGGAGQIPKMKPSAPTPADEERATAMVEPLLTQVVGLLKKAGHPYAITGALQLNMAAAGEEPRTLTVGLSNFMAGPDEVKCVQLLATTQLSLGQATMEAARRMGIVDVGQLADLVNSYAQERFNGGVRFKDLNTRDEAPPA